MNSTIRNSASEFSYYFMFDKSMKSKTGLEIIDNYFFLNDEDWEYFQDINNHGNKEVSFKIVFCQNAKN